MNAGLDSVLLDTSTLVALLVPEHPHHSRAHGYLQFLSTADVRLYASAISVAELGELFPYEHQALFQPLRLLSFNFKDARLAGAMAYQLRELLAPEAGPSMRDDLKLLAQCEAGRLHALLADDPHGTWGQLCQRLYSGRPPFRLLTLAEPHAVAFGLTGSLFGE